MRQVELSLEEVLDAENYIIKEMQKKEFNEEYTSLVKKNYQNTVSYLAFVQNLIVRE